MQCTAGTLTWAGTRHAGLRRSPAANTPTQTVAGGLCGGDLGGRCSRGLSWIDVAAAVSTCIDGTAAVVGSGRIGGSRGGCDGGSRGGRGARRASSGRDLVGACLRSRLVCTLIGEVHSGRLRSGLLPFGVSAPTHRFWRPAAAWGRARLLVCAGPPAAAVLSGRLAAHGP